MSSDLNLLAVSAKRDRAAMNRLIKQLQPGFVASIKRKRIHPNDREDAVQEVLIRAVSCVERYDPEQGDFENYVNASVAKALLTFHARQGRHHGRETTVERPAEAAPVPVATVKEVDELAHVAPAHRDIVRDFYGIGLQRSFSINQIAARRRMTNARVKTVLAEAVAVMKRNTAI